MNRIHSHLLGAVVALGLAASAAQAQARTWAFSRDTVYDWAANGDSVSLANSGSDTLKFDSIGLELVRPTSVDFEAGFTVMTSPNRSFILSVYNGNVSYAGYRPNQLIVNPGQSPKVVNFNAEHRIIQILKSSAIVQGDTLVMRLIFMASSNRGRDTLMLKGKADNPTSLLPGKTVFGKILSDERRFDLRGRRVEKLPEGVRSPAVPLVSPGK